MKELNVFWFRRDLRLDDNTGFHKALHGKNPVMPIFIFDNEILDSLEAKDDARVTFIHESLTKMNEVLKQYGSGISVFHGKPLEVFGKISEQFQIAHVISNRDYEPYALERDAEVEKFLSEKNIGFHTYKDHVIFEKDEIVKDNGTPYLVYTPYMKKWKASFKKPSQVKIYNSQPHFDKLWKNESCPFPSLESIGFQRSTKKVADYDVSPSLIKEYEAKRNFPSQNGTSQLSPHLRFGTVSIRKVISKAIAEENEVFWQELIWREFFMQILWHFPHTLHKAFKPVYDNIAWRNDTDEFQKWKEGKTGYPMVDAGMRELNETGYMHNRVRMVVASFLCKHLLIDWRWGEAYFAEKLLDYEMASNVGNWQWAAGCGVDAAPYFRIFNPITQLEKFDKDKEYVKKWVKEYGSPQYPTPMVDHKMARERCLNTYKVAIN